MKTHIPKYALESDEGLVKWACRVARYDVGRLSGTFGGDGLVFFIGGMKRSTKDDTKETGCIWTDETGQVKNWKYVAETTIAFGATRPELAASILEYANKLDQTMLDAMLEALGKDGRSKAAKAWRAAEKRAAHLEQVQQVHEIGELSARCGTFDLAAQHGVAGSYPW